MIDLEKLVDALQHPEPAIRTQAIYALGESGETRYVRPLVMSLRNRSHTSTHAAAIRALAKLGGDRAREALVEALDHDYLPVREAAVIGLGTMGDTVAVEPLIFVLLEGESPVRAAAARSLGQIGDPRAAAPLIDALSDSNEDVRYYAAAAVGQFGDPRAVEPLIDLLDDITHAYGGVVCEAAADALSQIGTAEALASVEIWRGRWDESRRAPTVEALTGDLSDPDWETRLQAAFMLGESGDVRAVDPLIGVLAHDADPDVRNVAAEALGKLGDVRALEPLLEALDRFDLRLHPGPIAALGQLGDERAVDPLIALLGTPDADIDYKAALALERIGSKPARKAVERWRKDQEHNPRFPPI
jgi:HEAT repeat protein